MALVRPRLTDHYGVQLAQATTDFAVPFLDEDIPLYVDPFLLWSSPALQETALHGAVVNAFNRLGHLALTRKTGAARALLIQASECDDIGLGFSGRGKGRRIPSALADQVLDLFRRIPSLGKAGFVHVEAVQLLVDGIAKDRISDIFCSFAKSYLIDYTMAMAASTGIPTESTSVQGVYDHRRHAFQNAVVANLPVHPTTKAPILLVPKRWLRKVPWIGYDDYVDRYYRKEILNPEGQLPERGAILTFNRDNYGAVERYVTVRELTRAECSADPLFVQLPVLSVKRRLRQIESIPTGNENRADKRYEEAIVPLLATAFYPYLDFASDQVRTDSGAQIRDLIFYNTRSVPFLQDVLSMYGSRQLVFELKNVRAVEREHINQLNRYLAHEFGNFGVLVTRNPVSSAIQQSLVDLWSAQRRCILPITDESLRQIVEVFDGQQRRTIDVVQAAYVGLSRKFPS